MSLDDTYNFLNTIELESGALVDHFATFDDAAAWLVDRGVCHENLGRPRRLGRDQEERSLASGLSGALREVAHAVAEDLRRTLHSRRSTGRSGRASGSSWCGPDGVSVGHSHVGDPLDDALARLADPLVKDSSPAAPSASASAPTTRANGSSSTSPVAASAAGATWRAAATGPRRPATGRGRRRPLPCPGGRYVAGTRSNSGRTSVVSRVIDSSSCGDGKPAMSSIAQLDERCEPFRDVLRRADVQIRPDLRPAVSLERRLQRLLRLQHDCRG